MASFPPLPAGLPLDAAEWEQTPPGVRQVVLQQQTTIQHLEARIKTLEARIAELEARLQQRSQNSDRPPSSDPPYEKRTARAGTQGSPGAKPGHPGHRQVLLEPTEVIEVKPPACACGQTECLDTSPYSIHQVIELPEIQMLVRHFVLYGRRQGFESKTHAFLHARTTELFAHRPFIKLEVSKRPKRTDLV